ncbi:hypothetical protein [Streptomyces abikoensis]|uniref:hypothetical protein n=1 Tax=Streptomyces abikoensis TaxID=97398 RepID=UPI001676DFB9|nr:hypothetical protein [Streptomyces abikoensis]GGP59984.1 hypothetical protein GCM10010214_36940 [Streptomyces abikoensis]
MTYREGAYVVDTRSATLAQVMGNVGPCVQIRRPGGGREWEAPADALRLATRAEREAAGLRGSAAAPSASPVGCAECARLDTARRAAGEYGELTEAAVDAMVAVRSHFREAHVLPAWPR